MYVCLTVVCMYVCMSVCLFILQLIPVVPNVRSLQTLHPPFSSCHNDLPRINSLYLEEQKNMNVLINTVCNRKNANWLL